MLARYARAPMTALWSDATRLNLWCLLEVALAKAQAKRELDDGGIPAQAASIIEKHARFDEELLARSEELEKETRHDVVAFLRALEERMVADEDKSDDDKSDDDKSDDDKSSGYSRYLHFGATSSDILDSAFAIQLVQAAKMLEQGLLSLNEAIKARAQEHKHSLCLGRSHGMAAEPTTFGLKLLSFYAEFRRAIERLRRAREEVSTISMSGTVGHYAFLHPDIEIEVAKYLNQNLQDALQKTLPDENSDKTLDKTLKLAAKIPWQLRREPIATQVIPRDRHAMFFATLGVIASSLERLSVEIRHLQRSEVAEVREGFSVGQTGSSAMPHKRNPILSENITGLARLVRMSVQPALENVALWHERDISHSSVERVIAPDSTITLDFAIARTTSVIANLQVFPARMEANLAATKGVLFSHGLLLALLKKGVRRKEAYDIIQRTSILALDQGEELKGEELAEILKLDEEIRSMFSEDEISTLSDNIHHTRHVDTLFERVLG